MSNGIIHFELACAMCTTCNACITHFVYCNDCDKHVHLECHKHENDFVSFLQGVPSRSKDKQVE